MTNRVLQVQQATVQQATVHQATTVRTGQVGLRLSVEKRESSFDWYH